MINKITSALIVFISAIHAAPLLAEENQSEPTEITCLSESVDGADHLQGMLETWFTSARKQDDEYLERIRQIESDEGVFDYGLVLELIGLGLLKQEQSSHEESAAAIQRALHIVRVNDGLYSIKQLPLLDLLIESNSALQKWKEVADSYDMMHWLYRRNYSDDDPRQLNTLKRLRRWHRESYNKDTGRSLEELFTKSDELYEQGLAIMLKCTGGNKRETMCFWHKSCCANEEPLQDICPLDRG
jgi:hypothetical protein